MSDALRWVIVSCVWGGLIVIALGVIGVCAKICAGMVEPKDPIPPVNVVQEGDNAGH